MLKKLVSLDAQAAGRVFGLDVMRAAAILIVVNAHANIALGAYLHSSVINYILPDGVELFFVLSGFLIGGILIRIYEKAPQFDGAVVRHFWVRRWFRTLPAYYLVLLGLIAIALFRAWRNGVSSPLPSVSVLATYFVFLQNFAHYIPTFFDETWSLAIEEWSYLILPITLWGLTKLSPNRWPRQRIILLTILLIIIGTNLLRLVRAWVIPISVGELGTRGIVLYRLDAIAYGVLAAYIKHYFTHFWLDKKWQRRLLILGLIFIVATAITASIWILKYYVSAGIYPYYVFYKRSLYFPVAGLAMTALLPFMDNWRNGPATAAGHWLTKAITHISLISYSMYLLNLSPIMITFIERIPTTSLQVGWLKVGVFWVLVLVLSTLMYKFYEKPATDLRERL